MSKGEVHTDTVRAVSRRANTYLRLVSASIIAVLLQVYIRESWCLPWTITYTAALAFDIWANKAATSLDRPQPAWRRLCAMAAPFIASATFGSAALPLFASSVRFAPALGAALLAGSLLNVLVVNAGRRSATLMAATPHALYLLGTPLIAMAVDPRAHLAPVLGFAAVILIVSVAVAARILDAALTAEAAAKAEAERRRHEAEEAVAAKSAFVAMISHELRTPISAILAGAARLHSEVPEASAKVHAQLITDAGGLMRALLNDLLDFSRLEAGRMTVENATFNLRQALSDTLRLWKAEAARKGLRLRVIGAASTPRWVSGDVTRLKQVLNNLLSNAIKFTERGEVTVSLATSLDAGAVRLSIAVRDTGPGLPEAALPRLFTPFDQLSASVVRRHGGSGLGLTISRELARLMGGDLVASNAPGEGACFTLTLTLEPAEAPHLEEDGRSICGLRVLVVDDHVVNRRAIELVLQPFGVDATLAESGEAALERLDAEVFDAVLMDVYMPGLDGRETTRALRAGSSPNRATPVIAVTASATAKDWEACAAAGMNAHVTKPIDPGELFGALAQALAGGAPVLLEPELSRA